MDAWFDPKPDVKKLAKHLFDLRTREQSTYRCTSSGDELENVTAFELLYDSPTIRKRYLLRIGPDDIAAVGIVPDEGEYVETGVRSVDSRHTNLIGSSSQFEQLIEVLVTEHEPGREIIRRFWDRQLAAQMRRFLELPESEVSPLAKERCHAKVTAMEDKIRNLR